MYLTQERAVPRYYFDSREGDRFIRDEMGIELDSHDAAEYEAAVARLRSGVISFRRGMPVVSSLR
jgi:hypothetical protein